MIMNPSPELIAQLNREDIEQAREMSPGEKLLAGGALYDEVIERMMIGIKTQFPTLTAEQVHSELCRRLDIHERLENHPWIPTKS
jgi:hypothetical protein